MESWQSGNAPDSKSGELAYNRRAGSNPVLSLKYGLKMLIYQSFILTMSPICHLPIKSLGLPSFFMYKDQVCQDSKQSFPFTFSQGML